MEDVKKEVGEGRCGSESSSVSSVEDQWVIVEPEKRGSPILDEMFGPVYAAIIKLLSEEEKRFKKEMKRK